MKRLPTKVAEKVYTILERYAEASPNYYDRESFIYHFGVVPESQKEYFLTCMDGARRVFTCTREKNMWLEGKGSERVNSILRKIQSEMIEGIEFGEFTVRRNEI
jgi:hypothetical protein